MVWLGLYLQMPELSLKIKFFLQTASGVFTNLLLEGFIRRQQLSCYLNESRAECVLRLLPFLCKQFRKCFLNFCHMLLKNVLTLV